MKLSSWYTHPNRRAPKRRRPLSLGTLSGFEKLESRLVPAIKATFSAGVGLLTVTGDGQDNTITVSRDAAGNILVNGGAIQIRGGTATVANTKLIQVDGQGGNDAIALDETNGTLPNANLFGGAGNDTLTGGSGNDQMFGEAGDDILLGKGGIDLLFGGAGNDSLTGGVGDDSVFGQAGNDRMIWNPGEGTDLNEGGAGTDTVEVNGGNGAETFTVTPNGSRVRFDRTTPGPFSLDIGTAENLVLNMNGGDDTFTAANGLSTLISLTVDGGAGNDSITGGDGADILFGGDGNDLIVGGRGNDTAFMGAGDDTFVWNPGDASDTIEGQDGIDTMLFNGANVNEKIDLSANGTHLRLFRDVGNVTMDANGVENVNINALGGVDTLTINDLSATDVKNINIDLAGTPGTGDGAADQVIVTGTNGNNNVSVVGAGNGYSVVGLSAQINVANSEGTLDGLAVNLLGGDDNFSAATLPAVLASLSVNGGAGNDSIVGSPGVDSLLGGDGDDFVDGKQGNDVAFLGAGNDTFQWDPGDGSDTVEGQDGSDKLIFNGANINENIDISANGSRVRFFRDVAGITMDLNGLEEIDFNALDGADNININSFTGTDTTTVNLNLNGSGGAGDGAADTVTFSGSNGNDTIHVASFDNGTRIGIGGTLSPLVNIIGAEPASDSLTVNALGGDDIVDASNLGAGLINLTLNGGSGNDFIAGSPGNDLIIGGQGTDTAMMGDGDDTFVWNPGDGSDTLEGQGGYDTMLFNGANINENIDISANGTRVRFFRDVASITMDVNGTEAIVFNALGGADTIVVHDLTGTDVSEVDLNLAANGGGGDGAADNVIVEATTGDDSVFVNGDASGTTVTGLSAAINITGAESNLDRLTVNAQAGDDVVDASGLTVTGIQLTANGGDGDDVLVGGDGADNLSGGVGDDVLIGGPGNDILDGGVGDNILIQ